MKSIKMDKEQIKEAILGKPNCRNEETPLCKYATFEPDMEMVEILLKGGDIQKSFNNQPLPWVHQFCQPNWDKLLVLLFKYKYYGLHLDNRRNFGSLLRMLAKVKPSTLFFVTKTMKKHNFKLSVWQKDMIKRENYVEIQEIYKSVFDL